MIALCAPVSLIELCVTNPAVTFTGQDVVFVIVGDGPFFEGEGLGNFLGHDDIFISPVNST